MKMKQTDRILTYMRDFGSISTREAFIDLGVARLASRIHDLRRLGYPIDGVMVQSKDRYGEPVSYKRYSLGEAIENNTSVSAPQ